MEGLVAQHLRTWCAYRNIPCHIHFWRTRAGLEVDFVLYGRETFLALEVKNTATIRPKTLNALRAFGQEYPEAETCLLYRGRERLLIDDIFCLPVEAFLSRLHPDMPLSYALQNA